MEDTVQISHASKPQGKGIELGNSNLICHSFQK